MTLKRRSFLGLAGTYLITATAPFASRLAAAADGNPSPGNAKVFFPQGVASGDPTQESVILWTRAQGQPAGDIKLTLQLSTEESFAALLAEQEVLALASEDHTVRAQIAGLAPGQHYYYRFVAAAGGQSRTGRTMTAPEAGDARSINLAFASCQNYEQGYFGAWQRMIAEDRLKPEHEQIQFVLHLGDFIYERYRNQQVEGDRIIRDFPPYPDGAREADGARTWAQTLADYRHLYQTYLEDPDLQDARARWPFICTWDDHEFTNNAFQHFSNYEGDIKPELQRKRDANKAWFEYIPARVANDTDNLKIYRDLRWGQLDLLLTDLRSYRSAPPIPEGLVDELELPGTPIELVAICDGGRDYADGNPPQLLPFGDGTTPNPAADREPRTIFGDQQKAWFFDKLANSGAHWKVWGNSLPALPLRLDLSNIPLLGLPDCVLGQDAWSGYPGDYNELLDWVQQQGIGPLVSLSGDHHCQAAATLSRDPADPQSVPLAVDFNVSGISSTPVHTFVWDTAKRGGNSTFMDMVRCEAGGETINTFNLTMTRGALSSIAYANTGWDKLSDWLGPNSANHGLSYLDSDSNGYGLASFSRERCEVQLVTIEAPLVASGSNGSAIKHIANFSVDHWSKQQTPGLKGPQFERSAPFPWAESTS